MSPLSKDPASSGLIANHTRCRLDQPGAKAEHLFLPQSADAHSTSYLAKDDCTHDFTVAYSH